MRRLAEKENLKKIGIALAVIVFIGYSLHKIIGSILLFFALIIYGVCYLVHKKDTRIMPQVDETEFKDTKEFLMEITGTDTPQVQSRIRDYINDKIKKRYIPVLYKGLVTREDFIDYFRKEALKQSKYKPTVQKIPQGIQFEEKVKYIDTQNEIGEKVTAVWIEKFGIGMVGYVPNDKLEELKNVLKKRIKSTLVVASGGDYRKMGSNREFNSDYRLKISIRYYN